MLIINSWTGRSGNSILQIIRAIHYAILNNHHIIHFQKHILLNSNKIVLHNERNYNNKNISSTFFYLQEFNISDPEPYIMKEYFQKYVKPIFKIQNNVDTIHDNSLYIHFRGGDIFSSCPHKAYVQPPLTYYKNTIQNYDIVKLVCEDKSNPCINELLKHKNIEYISNTLENDLYTLSNAYNLVIGFGTFGFLLYLMNPKLENLYIPDFFANELPKGNWGNNIKVHIVNLPNYIKVGEWKNSDEQRKMMLEY